MVEKLDYELNELATIEMLKVLGFREIMFNNKIILSYYQELIRDIDLFVEFDITKNVLKFDEDKNVSVIDDEDGQYYMPFYDKVDSDYVNRVTERYNQVMNSLVNKNILKVKKKEETKVLSKTK